MIKTIMVKLVAIPVHMQEPGLVFVVIVCLKLNMFCTENDNNHFG